MCDDQPDSIFYRPRGHDVLVYDTENGQMRMHACGERERKVLLRAFGSCLFGNPEHFTVMRQYTLQPLVQRGRACLACADVPGIEKVSLVEVDIFRPATMLEVRYRCQDVFSIVGKEFEWPRDVEHIKRAKFKVKFRDARQARQLTIAPWNKVLYGRDGDSTTLKRWVCRREFALIRVDFSASNNPSTPIGT